MQTRRTINLCSYSVHRMEAFLQRQDRFTMSRAYLQSLAPVRTDHAQGTQKEVLQTALRQVGFIPNMYANMANAPAVLSTYLHGYALFRSESGLSAVEQEVVFLAISQANECRYCTAAHSMIADKRAGVSGPVLAAIRAGDPIPDARLAALHALTTELVHTSGRPHPGRVQECLAAGFSERQVLYIILAIAVKTLSNYTNHALGTEVDAVFAAYQLD